MTWKILALATIPIIVATVATIWIVGVFGSYTEALDSSAQDYVAMLEQSTLSHDAKMSDLQTQLDEALAQLEAAEQRNIASADEFKARLGDLEATATAGLESFNREIDDIREDSSAAIADTAKQNSEFRAQLKQDVESDAAERLTAAENAANAEIASAVSYAKSKSDEVQDAAAETLLAVKHDAEDYLAQTGTSLQNFTSEQQGVVQNFVDEQTVILETHINEQKSAQDAFAEEIRNDQTSFTETQKTEQQQFIEEQTAAREAMRTQAEEIAGALSEGHPMSWTAIDYTSAAEPRQEDEVVKVFGRGASIDTQFAVVNVTRNDLGEASVIGVAVEPIDSPILAFVELPDERFRINRTAAVRFYRPNSSQPVEAGHWVVGRILFKEDGINCNKTKVYSYLVNDNRLTELGDGCGWFDLPNRTYTRIYILAENVQD